MIFNEKALRQEISERWGEHGAHIEVFDMMLDKCNKYDAIMVSQTHEAILQKHYEQMILLSEITSTLKHNGFLESNHLISATISDVNPQNRLKMEHVVRISEVLHRCGGHHHVFLQVKKLENTF